MMRRRSFLRLLGLGAAACATGLRVPLDSLPAEVEYRADPREPVRFEPIVEIEGWPIRFVRGQPARRREATVEPWLQKQLDAVFPPRPRHTISVDNSWLFKPGTFVDFDGMRALVTEINHGEGTITVTFDDDEPELHAGIEHGADMRFVHIHPRTWITDAELVAAFEAESKSADRVALPDGWPAA